MTFYGFYIHPFKVFTVFKIMIIQLIFLRAFSSVYTTNLLSNEDNSAHWLLPIVHTDTLAWFSFRFNQNQHLANGKITKKKKLEYRLFLHMFKCYQNLLLCYIWSVVLYAHTQDKNGSLCMLEWVYKLYIVKGLHVKV